MKTLWMVWPAILTLGCELPVKRVTPAAEDTVWPSAELLCRYSVFELPSLDFARHDAALSAVVMPEELKARPPCEGDLGEVSKCTQDNISLMFVRAVAPHVRCERIAAKREGDWVQFEVRQECPRVSWERAKEFLDGTLDITTVPLWVSEHTLHFRFHQGSWLAVFGASDLSW